MQVNDIKKVGIAGVGVMGASMAQRFAQYGYDVVIYNIRAASLERGKKSIALNQQAQIQSGTLTQEQSQALLSRISYSADTECFCDMDIIVESIVEDLAVKQEFWERISRIVRKDTILATNTSGLSITQIARDVKDPQRFVGFHWFNPPHLVPLIEVIRGEKTDDATAEAVYALAKKIDKQPVTVKKDAKGFLANRIQLAILREAMYIVEQGIADIEDVDAAMKYGLGFRYACLGPFEVADLGGLDTFYHIAKYLMPDLCDDAEVSALLADHFEAQEYGVKAKKGFYDYSDGKDEQAIRVRDTNFIRLYNCLFK